MESERIHHSQQKSSRRRPHLANNAVLHIGLLVASLFAHQCDLQLTERFGQDVTLCEELSPLHDVRFEQCRVILVTQHALKQSDEC